MNGYDARRTHANIDPDTPIISLGDKRPYRREAIVLVSDEERDLWSELVGHQRMMRERGIRHQERKAFHQTMWGRAAIAAALLAAFADLVSQLMHSGH